MPDSLYNRHDQRLTLIVLCLKGTLDAPMRPSITREKDRQRHHLPPLHPETPRRPAWREFTQWFSLT
ncbi:hypothetical protein HZA56_13010 [Candidatus Poribacteria bacterium]|nr:hypothetical protein [Candidatus Poribacteria bacterium]